MIDRSDWKEVNIHDYIVKHNIPVPPVDPEALADAEANMIKVNSIEEAAKIIIEGV